MADAQAAAHVSPPVDDNASSPRAARQLRRQAFADGRDSTGVDQKYGPIRSRLQARPSPAVGRAPRRRARQRRLWGEVVVRSDAPPSQLRSGDSDMAVMGLAQSRVGRG